MTTKRVRQLAEKKDVVGKELILSKKLLKTFLETEFDKKVNLQDIWLDKETKDVHIKVAAIVDKGTNPLEGEGFVRIINPADYEVKEKFDDRFIQLIQSSAVLNKEW